MALRAGAGKSPIEIPDRFLPTEGFTCIHDNLYTRVLLLENGSSRVALAVVDLTSMPAHLIDGRKQIVSRMGAVDPSGIWICTSHTFSAPHYRPEVMLTSNEEKEKNGLLLQAIDKSLGNAAAQAKGGLQPAKLGYGAGQCGVNVNRDIPTSDGWWLGGNDQGTSDKEVSVIRIESLAGKPIAVCANYAVQSSVMNEAIMEDGGKPITSDLFGSAARHVEQRYGSGCVALFTVGAAGDQEPFLTANRHTVDQKGAAARADIHGAGFYLMELLGERLGDRVFRICEQICCTQVSPVLQTASGQVRCSGQAIPQSIRDIHATKQYTYQSGKDLDVPIWIMQIGDMELVGVQVEFTCKTGLEIKKRSPFPHTMVLTMVNGAAKYMADEESYNRITYEAMNSKFAKGSAEKAEKKILSMLEDYSCNEGRK